MHHPSKAFHDTSDDDLIQNIEKIHTTPLGAERVKRNLDVQISDIVSWCKEAAMHADLIICNGKNWYVYWNGNAITINAHSFTVITAHKINAKVRIMRESDYICLNEFLYQAIFIPEGAVALQRSVINKPEIFVYIKDFGTRSGDLGVVAEQNGQVVGAAWTRIIPAYGHIDDNTPELCISILPPFRSYGIGAKLMKKLFGMLRENGYTQTSLSVNKANPAVRFYQRLGYVTYDARTIDASTVDTSTIDASTNDMTHDDYLMIKIL